MKKQLLLLLALVATGLGYAQKELSKDYSYTISKPFKGLKENNPFSFSAYKILYNRKDYFYKNGEVMVFKLNKDDILIEKINVSGDKASFIKDKQYKINDLFEKNFQIEGVIEFAGKYYFFYSSWNGDDEQEQLYYREIDFNKGEFVGENKLLFKIDGKVTQSTDMGQETFFGKFNIHLNPDKTKMLINYRKKPLKRSDKKSYDTYGINAYGMDMIELWRKELTMPYTERRMDLLDFTIDKDANAYLLAKVFHDDSNDDKKHKKDEKPNYHLEIFRVNAGSSNIDITKVDFQDKFLKKLTLYSHEDHLICAGFYNKGKSTGSVDGIMLFKVKPDGVIYDSSSHEIPFEILNEFASKKAKKKNKKDEEDDEAEFANLDLDKLVIEKDGSVVFVGEQYYEVTVNTGKSVRIIDHYADMLISKVDASGKLAWMKRLPKHQVGSSGIGGMSYKHFYANDNHYIVYLDNVKNLNLPPDEYPAIHTDGAGGYLTSYKINDATGESVKSSILNVRDLTNISFHNFGVGKIVKAGEDAFIVEVANKEKQSVMLKVVMKK
ncbi:hypothetical protein ACLI1A_18560 [Flavobacterium sp. RHBU_3]|uniref:hypothetical protein n=1 Tax=Flavobacterium sp. RHBU_3 TaxID=3391184 RepID=UPI0039854DDC